MASDEDYTSFLEKANQDTGATHASSQSASAVTKAVDTDVPATLQKVQAYYTSDADEPFEPVSLKWKGKDLPSERMCPLPFWDVRFQSRQARLTDGLIS